MKRILFLTYRIPEPALRDGYSIRILGLAKILRTEYRVDLVSLYQNEKELEQKIELQKIFNDLYVFQKNIFAEYLGAIKGMLTQDSLQESIYFSSRMQTWIKENYKKYNLIFCGTLRTVKYVKNLDIPKVVDLIESLTLKYSRAIKFVNPFWKLVYKIEIPRIEKKEEEIFKNFNKVLISSPFDKKFLEKEIKSSLDNLIVIPNGVKGELLTSSRQLKTSNQEENWISFFGKMDYQPNEDAVSWFSKEVFPKILAKSNKLKFYIIGTSPTPKITQLESDNIKVTGCLKNPYEILRKSKLIIIPIRFGAGIQNKILESMALGKAIITSPIGAQGIKEAKSGEHFEIVKSANHEIWAEKITKLILDSQKRNRLGIKARLLIEENYRWEQIGQQLLRIIHELTD